MTKEKFKVELILYAESGDHIAHDLQGLFRQTEEFDFDCWNAISEIEEDTQ